MMDVAYPGCPGKWPLNMCRKDDGGGGDNWSYKTCKAPVKSSPPTNQHRVYLQPGCPS